MRSSTVQGYLSIILTGHVPYLRSPGRHPHGEEALHETIAFGLVPTLNALFDVRDAGLRTAVGLAFSPVLIEQLADIVVQKHFTIWMEDWIASQIDTLARWERQSAVHGSYLARFSIDWGREVLHRFVERYGRNLPGALRELCASGAEPLFTAATHAVLPFLSQPAMHAQLHQGRLSTMRHFGVSPGGLWLPECAYAPALAPLIAANDAQYTIVDPASLPEAGLPEAGVVTSAEGRWRAFIRDTAASRHVWSAELGYMGDPLYRSPARDPRLDVALWRNGTSGAPTELYDPYDAYRRAEEHATHFVAAVSAHLEAHYYEQGQPGLAIVPLDLELIGRRWFEGPLWLRAVLMRAAGSTTIRLATPGQTWNDVRPSATCRLVEGAWGDVVQWRSPQARPLWEALSEAEERLSRLVAVYPDAQASRERALNQALRELMLAQSSDWPLLAGSGQAEQAVRHVTRHLERFELLCNLAEQPELSEHELDRIADLEEIDNPFPHLNYRVFAGSEAPG
jgi:1,4-alpha-glucan branching enzyme